MPRFIKKVKQGFILEDTKGHKYSGKPLSYKKALAQERAIFLQEQRKGKRVGGSHWRIYEPQAQVSNILQAQNKRKALLDFGTIMSNNPIRKGGHLYYSNI